MTDQPIKQIVPGIIEVNSSTLLIGPTGSGKTALMATAYEYVWETHRKVSLHYNSDPGGFPDKLRALMAYGIVRVWRMQSRGTEYSFETAHLASRGYWPAKIDPKSGMSPKGVRLIPPVVTTYIETCGHCNQEAGRSIAVATLMRGQCPHCKQVRSNQTSKITQQQTVAKGFENIGARGYDGLTSISDWYLQDMSHRVELGGEEGSVGGKINSGDLSWRQNNRAQVGFAQSRVHELITNSLEIPGMVIMPIWTAISDETTDEGGLPVVGPKLAGSAKTDIAPQWFGNVFESLLDVNQQGNKIRRVYLSEYIDNRNRRHLLKHRGDGRLVPEYVEDAPYQANGQPPAEIFTNFHLGHIYKLLESSLQATMEDVGMRYPDAPGLDAVPSEYGLDVPADVPVPQVAAGPRPVVAAPRARGSVRKPAAAVTPAVAAPAASVQAPTPAQATPAEAATQAMPKTEALLGHLVGQAATETAAAADAAQEPTIEHPSPAPPIETTAVAEAPAAAVQGPAAPAAAVTAAAPPSPQPPPGAWAPPPGSTLKAPRAPAATPRARPVARPVAASRK